MSVVEIVVALLQAVATLVPGLLSGMTGHDSDAAFVAAARNAIERIPAHPVSSAIAAVRARPTQPAPAPAPTFTPEELTIARDLIHTGPLMPREAGIIRRLVEHAEKP